MAKYGSDQVAITIDTEDITAFVTTLNGVNIQAIVEDSTPFGVAWQEQLFSGVKAGDNITIGGFYDDSVDGPKDLLKAKIGDTVALVVTYGGSNSDSGNCIVQSFATNPAPKSSTKWTATLVWTGTITSA